MSDDKIAKIRKPCEYCGVNLPLGVSKETRRVRSFHFANCEKRLQITPPPPDIEAQSDALLPEVERLTRERDEARAEVERMRAQMQEIRERLHLAAGHAAAAALLSEEAHRKALEAKP